MVYTHTELAITLSIGPYISKSTSNDRFFEKLFTAILFTLRVFATNLPKEDFHIFDLMPDLGIDTLLTRLRRLHHQLQVYIK